MIQIYDQIPIFSAKDHILTFVIKKDQLAR